MTATRLVGLHIRNPAGEDLGTVENVCIDVATGRVASLAVSFGGLLGVGSRHFELPWEELEFDADAGALRLDISRDDLEAARGRPPATEDRLQAWRDEVTRAYLEHLPPM